MHIKATRDNDGDFSKYKGCDRRCPNCEKLDSEYRIWESHCGGYEDYQYHSSNNLFRNEREKPCAIYLERFQESQETGSKR